MSQTFRRNFGGDVAVWQAASQLLRTENLLAGQLARQIEAPNFVVGELIGKGRLSRAAAECAPIPLHFAQTGKANLFQTKMFFQLAHMLLKPDAHFVHALTGLRLRDFLQIHIKTAQHQRIAVFQRVIRLKISIVVFLAAFCLPQPQTVVIADFADGNAQPLGEFACNDGDAPPCPLIDNSIT